jgi:hypothetical protein
VLTVAYCLLVWGLKMNKTLKQSAVASLVFVAAAAHAVPPATVGDLVTALDFSTVGLAVLGVFAAAIAFQITVKGGQWVYHKVKSV